MTTHAISRKRMLRSARTPNAAPEFVVYVSLTQSPPTLGPPSGLALSALDASRLDNWSMPTTNTARLIVMLPAEIHVAFWIVCSRVSTAPPPRVQVPCASFFRGPLRRTRAVLYDHSSVASGCQSCHLQDI